MFPHACSLRSTPCAALIALAAAAGIVRVPEPAPPRVTAPFRTLDASRLTAPLSPAASFLLVHPSVTPWLRPVTPPPVPANPGDRDENEIPPAVIAPAELRSPGAISFLPERSTGFPSTPAIAGSAGAHRLPFAAGPPARGKYRHVVSVVLQRARVARPSVTAQRGKESVRSGFSPCAANRPSAQAESFQGKLPNPPDASAALRRRQRPTRSFLPQGFFS